MKGLIIFNNPVDFSKWPCYNEHRPEIDNYLTNYPNATKGRRTLRPRVHKIL